MISQIHGANRLGGNTLLDTMFSAKLLAVKQQALAKERIDEQES